MKISCQLQNINSNQKNLPEGKFLVIHTEGKDEIYIPFIEFSDLYKEEKGDVSSIDKSPNISFDNMPLDINKDFVRPNFSKLMGYLKEKIGINEAIFKSKNKLVIESNFDTFLELPWEDLVNEKIFVLRKVLGNKKNDSAHSPASLMIILSNSRSSNNGKRSDLKKKLKTEVLEIASSTIEVQPKDFKINDIYISKHTTKIIFKLLSWDNCNYVHFIMHGSESGGLCLENENIDEYKKEDILEVKDALRILKEKKLFLIFFSHCNSSSFAYEVVNNGIAKYTIGYRQGVGETSANVFSRYFYKNLLSSFEKNTTDRLEKVYIRSLIGYYKSKDSDDKYVPLLYINK